MLDRAKKNNRCKAICIPNEDENKLTLKIHMPNTKPGKRLRPDGMGHGPGGTFRGEGEVGPDGVPLPIGYRGKEAGEVRINFSVAGKRGGTRNAAKAEAAEAAKAHAEAEAEERAAKCPKLVIVPVVAVA